MLFNQRVIHDDDGTLTDISRAVNDLFTDEVALPIVAADDKLYIGSDLPFNHRFLYLGTTVNTLAAAVSTVEIWDGGAWVPAVDLVDETSVAAKTLARSGVLQWTTDRSKTWGREDTTEDIAALASLKIYDFYWARLTFSADLTAGTALRYIGHRFSDDGDLQGRYPDLLKTEVLTAFLTGKTDWIDQHVLAAEEILKFLRKKRAIWSPSQLLHWQQFNTAAVHKTAEIIYSAFGKEMESQAERARERYFESLEQGVWPVDEDADGHVDRSERYQTDGSLRRR